MKWQVRAADYQIWQGFSLAIPDDLLLESGKAYHLRGNNGSGKTSFLRKVLIPNLIANPQNQYLVYFEQQAQSQLDALNAYASLQKPPLHIVTFESLLMYQLDSLKAQLQIEKRPAMIILDECPCPELLLDNLTGFDTNNVCIIYVSHTGSQAFGLMDSSEINTVLHFPGKAILS